MAKKNKGTGKQESAEKKGSPIVAQLGKSGKGVIATVGEVLKKSRKKSGMSRKDVYSAMEIAYGDEKRSTVNAQLSAKYPPRVGVSNAMDVEVIDGKTTADRRWKFIAMASDEQIAEWKTDIKEAKAARKVAKAEPEAEHDSANGAEENDTSRELTKAEKKAAKKAKKAAKKAKKAAK